MGTIKFNDLSETLKQRIRRDNPTVFEARSEASRTQPKQRIGNAPHADSEVKASNPRKRLVRITCFRARQLQDPDNGIYKWHIDALRRSGLLDDDTAQAIRLEIQPEVKVATVAEERTEIIITPL